MANQTFDQWLANKGMYYTSDVGPGLISNNSYRQFGGRNTVGTGEMMQQYQKEIATNALSGLMSGESSAGSNPFGVPIMSTDNRFSQGLSDAETRLQALLDNPDAIQQTAAYKFRVGQGQQALERSLGAKGLLRSGNRLQDLTKYGQDMASQEYENQFGRLGNLLGNYSTSYIGDKNANTNAFQAQANAWNQANNANTQLKAIALREMLSGSGLGGGSRTTSGTSFSNLGMGVF